MAEDCIKGTENEQKIKSLQAQMFEVKDTIKDTREDIRDMKDNLLNRPTWGITILLNLMLAITVASITFVITFANTRIGG